MFHGGNRQTAWQACVRDWIGLRGQGGQEPGIRSGLVLWSWRENFATKVGHRTPGLTGYPYDYYMSAVLKQGYNTYHISPAVCQLVNELRFRNVLIGVLTGLHTDGPPPYIYAHSPSRGSGPEPVLSAFRSTHSATVLRQKQIPAAVRYVDVSCRSSSTQPGEVLTKLRITGTFPLRCIWISTASAHALAATVQRASDESACPIESPHCEKGEKHAPLDSTSRARE
jgi:hypothetical protein